jgi:hypothetical protein
MRMRPRDRRDVRDAGLPPNGKVAADIRYVNLGAVGEHDPIADGPALARRPDHGVPHRVHVSVMVARHLIQTLGKPDAHGFAVEER